MICFQFKSLKSVATDAGNARYPIEVCIIYSKIAFCPSPIYWLDTTDKKQHKKEFLCLITEGTGKTLPCFLRKSALKRGCKFVHATFYCFRLRNKICANLQMSPKYDKWNVLMAFEFVVLYLFQKIFFL